MLSPEEIKKELGKFTSTEKEKLKIFQGYLDQVIQKDAMDEDSLKILDNLTTELEIFKTTYIWKFIRLLKLHHKTT